MVESVVRRAGASDAMTEHRKGGLRGRSYWALIVAQFLGAFNDNAYRMVVLLLVSAGLVASQGGARYQAGATAAFAVAYIVFSSAAGHLADRFGKRRIVVLAKVAEIVVMGLAFFALLAGDRITPILVLFLMAVQSTFFSPAKYGILPEILEDEELSAGNGIINMMTYVGILAGTVVGGWLMDAVGGLAEVDGRKAYTGSVHHAALVFVGLAALGTLVSLFVREVPPAGSRSRLRWNFLAGSWEGVRRVRRDRSLFVVMLASTYVWVVGAVFVQNIAPYGWETLRVEQGGTIGTLVGVLGIGVAAGSLLAGKLSRRKIELGLVPFGGMGIAACSVALAYTGWNLWLTRVDLLCLGLFVGLFAVPLSAYIQQRSPRDARGETIAVLNFITFCGVLVGAMGVFVLAEVLTFDPAHIFLALGVASAAVTMWLCVALPILPVRCGAWLAAQTLYDLRVVGAERVPREGPALLVCNHVSLADAVLVTASLQRPVRFVLHREYCTHPLLRWATRRLRAIPVDPDEGPEAVARAFAAARRALAEDGALVCVFAEESVTRPHNLLGFRSGFEQTVRGTGAPVVPVHIDRAWGGIFRLARDRVAWRWPRGAPYPATVSFGRPMPASATVHEVRAAVAELAAAACGLRRGARVLLHRALLRTARRLWAKPCVADSSGARLTYGGLLTAAALVGKRIRQLARGDDHLGLLLPPSVAGVTANIAALFAGKVPVNLNPTASGEAMRSAIEQCRIRRVLTSRAFVEKTGLDLTPDMVMLEDVTDCITGWDRVRGALAMRLLPRWLLALRCGRRGLRPDDPATVIFSSGSTGTPKGVILSHRNIASNIDGFCQVLAFGQDDCLCGVLPFFHAFGFTATLWAPLLRQFRAVYHPNPLEGRTVGRLIRRHQATHLIATPTFLMAYTRQCEPEDLRSLRLVIAGAEKLKARVADRFQATFGIRPLEGYGCTELSPVVAVNFPDRRTARGRVRVGTREGTIGQPLPNVAAKVVDPETGEPLPDGREGLLLIKGPNVMSGYLGDPEKTAEVIRDGWYRTGDIAGIDEDGFITITDRLSRFSKIGGEMVPHLAVEEAITAALGVPATEHVCVVTSVPDAQRGERLAVLHTPLPISADELWERLNGSGLPKLWIPRREMFRQIDAIPLLGSGKIALAQVKQLAAELWG